MGKPTENSVALADAWRIAADDLGIELVAPYQLEEGFEFVALVRHFGSPKGMLVLARWDEGHAAAAARCDFGYSCMDSPFYQTYDRQLFVDVLTDWSWTGEPAARPAWYTESSDDIEAI
jgi:hypothetical protein